MATKESTREREMDGVTELLDVAGLLDALLDVLRWQGCGREGNRAGEKEGVCRKVMGGQDQNLVLGQHIVWERAVVEEELMR